MKNNRRNNRKGTLKNDEYLTKLFNFGWKFHLGDLGNAEKVQFDDASWKAVDLSCDFQINQPWDKNAKGENGFVENLVSVNKIRKFYNRVLNVRNLKEENVTYNEMENLQ